MKIQKTLITCVMLLASTAAFAQASDAMGNQQDFRMSPKHGDQPSQLRDSNPKIPKDGNYTRIQMGYNSMEVADDRDDRDDTNLHGVSVSYLRGIKLNQSQPFFLEVGGKIAYNMKKETEDVNIEGIEDKVFHIDATVKVLTLSVPINLTYRIALGNGKWSLSPFAGITLKGNLSAKVTTEFNREKETLDLFDKDDVGKDGKWERIQVGWQTGINLDTNSPFTIGLQHGHDINNVYKKAKTSNWSVTIGWKF